VQNSTLNSAAAAEANIGGIFGLEDFTYNNTSVLKVLSGHINKTDFLGLSVRQTRCLTMLLPLIPDLSPPLKMVEETMRKLRT